MQIYLQAQASVRNYFDRGTDLGWPCISAIVLEDTALKLYCVGLQARTNPDVSGQVVHAIVGTYNNDK
jgi:hypothetical protein